LASRIEISAPVVNAVSPVQKTEKKIPKAKIRILRASIFIIILLWCAGFSLISLFPQNEIFLVFYPVLKKIYSGFCHQDQEKSIYIGEYFLVCTRCSGIYFGTLLSAFASIFIFTNKKFHLSIKTGFIFITPVICDIILYNTGFYNYSAAAAFSTGVIFGSGVIIFILSLIENNFFYNPKGLN